jgi:hypothetical protein
VSASKIGSSTIGGISACRSTTFSVSEVHAGVRAGPLHHVYVVAGLDVGVDIDHAMYGEAHRLRLWLFPLHRNQQRSRRPERSTGN